DVTSTWTALGSSGGGTYTCSGQGTGTITGLSGNTYCTATYPDATTDLKNLRWTISNLMEAGESATNYEDQTEDRGYYYTWAQAKPTGDDDICKKHLNRYYRIPTDADWALLIAGYASMTEEEKAAWKGMSSLAGFRHSNGTWLNWGSNGYWWSSSVTDKGYSLENTGSWITNLSRTDFWFSVRCVRNI
ncbi:MAG: fibrobacter succinogenes major paralogous domain-containing protein, partial [Candidatus Symbiothrix sp.]|nr:fibrobacter succinogenes major paralogous domain-containing protein [Candidatus Symbiothrix sp.]